MSSNTPRQPTRRDLLKRGAMAAGGLATLGMASAAQAAKASPASLKWDHETDVVCVGSGAAACAAAVTAVGQGGKAILVEKMPLPGGTTGKSGGVTWIPNNPSCAPAASTTTRPIACASWPATPSRANTPRPARPSACRPATTACSKPSTTTARR